MYSAATILPVIRLKKDLWLYQVHFGLIWIFNLQPMVLFIWIYILATDSLLCDGSWIFWLNFSASDSLFIFFKEAGVISSLFI